MEKLNLVPLPREIKQLGGEVRLSAGWRVWLELDNETERYAGELLQVEVKNCYNWEWQIASELPPSENNVVIIKSVKAEEPEPELFKQQGYYLWIKPTQIIIAAPSAVGRFYGVQTLRQLIRTARDQTLPLLEIKDYPALEWRGVSDDISRGQVSNVNHFIEIIQQLAFYKKNLYQPYIEDMFRFDTDPNIGKDRGAITKTEMALMVEAARKNHVVLTPVFECLGHQDRLLSLPENRKYAEVQDPGSTPWSFSPVNPEALEFIKKLIDELVAATESPFFHIGGDESWDVGKGTSKKLVRKIGVGRVHAQFFSRLNDYIKQRHNRQMMLYGDMLLRHPEALTDMPKDCIIVDWHYLPAPDYPSLKKFKEAGFQHIMASPALWSWSGFYPNYSLGFNNIATFADVAKREKIMGCITSSWGDNGAENLRENNLTGFAYSAAAEWEVTAPSVEEFLSRFVAIQYGAELPAMVEVEKQLGWLEYLEETYPAHSFHRTPKIKPYSETWLNKMKTLKKNMEEVLEKISASRQQIRFQRAHLDTLEHVARRYLFMANKYLILDDISRQLGAKKFGELPLDQQTEIIRSLQGLRDTLSKLIAEYQELWLRHNKFPRLEFNLERLQTQLAYFQDFLTQAYAGELTVYKAPQSVWFWYPEADPTVATTPGTKYFMRVINVEKEPIDAELKCWADDKAEVFLNGEKVLQVSYGDAPKRKTLNYLTKGKNYLAVQAENTYGAGGILLKVEITFKDSSKQIITGDEEWRTAERVKSNWQTRAPKGKNWKPVKLLGSGLIEPWTFIDW